MDQRCAPSLADDFGGGVGGSRPRGTQVVHVAIEDARAASLCVATLRGDARRDLDQPTDHAAMQGRQHDVADQRIAIRQMDFNGGVVPLDFEPKVPRVRNALQQALPSGPGIAVYILGGHP